MIEYPLLIVTPKVWAEQALSSPLDLLNDHFHLEKKAASNALDMMGRWQGQSAPIRWFTLMSAIAKDETDHMKMIAKLIAKRGGTCTKLHVNPYAKALHGLIRRGTAQQELMDRLLISALIEIRSCERFECLADHTTDPELSKLYRGLWGSERGHYRQFFEAAGWIQPQKTIDSRWQDLCWLESKIIQEQEPGPRIHSWI